MGAEPHRLDLGLKGARNALCLQWWRSGEDIVGGVLAFELVGARGFEPPTSRSQTERTTRLCYAPKVEAF